MALSLEGVQCLPYLVEWAHYSRALLGYERNALYSFIEVS